jgi:hypothetical protein
VAKVKKAVDAGGKSAEVLVRAANVALIADVVPNATAVIIAQVTVI